MQYFVVLYLKSKFRSSRKKMNIMQTINITAYTDNNSQIEEIKSAIKKLGIKFELTTTETPYNPEFVNMVLEAEQEIKQGKGLKVTSAEFDDLWK